VDPAVPHSPGNVGHEMSDFSFSTVLWVLPISVVILVAFTLTCLFWFRGAKDSELALRQAEYVPTELHAYQTQQDEILNSYKILDKDKGLYRVPVERAMELIAQEHRGQAGRAWVPITDSYLEGAAFAMPAAATAKPNPAPAALEGNGIKVEDAPVKAPAKPAESGHKAETRGAEGKK
jgi:hypothetical protein